MKEDLLRVLENELKPALGCTEPMAIALAVAKAKSLLQGEANTIFLSLSGNVIKNAMGVGIPGTDFIGIKPAVALAYLAGNPDKGLKVLEDIQPEDVERVTAFMEEKAINIKRTTAADKLFVQAELISDQEQVVVTIERYHDLITNIEVNGKLVLADKEEIFQPAAEEKTYYSVQEILEFARNVELASLDVIRQGLALNKALAMEGLEQSWGLSIGKTIDEHIKAGILTDDLMQHTIKYASAAIDARMDGASLAAMSNSGSGDQGIFAFMTTYGAWKYLDLPEEKLYRALVIANLLPISIKAKLGRLSAMCGVVIAGVGSVAAITYLLGGTDDQIALGIQNHIAGITGLICDGAKNSCSLKAASSASSAVVSSLIASKGIGVNHHEGIIHEEVDQTLLKVAELGKTSMDALDDSIIQMMISK